MADFLLTEEQTQLKDWVHGFAVDVVRPAAHEWRCGLAPFTTRQPTNGY